MENKFEIQKNQPLYSDELNSSGHSSLSLENGDHLSGTCYTIDEMTYLVAEDEKHEGKIYDMNKDVFVEDPSIINKVKNLSEKDASIKEARKQRAEQLAGGDEDLEHVYYWNMEYSNGDVDKKPLKKDEIDFYQVGRNASHDFFVGVKDGKKYRLSFMSGEFNEDSLQKEEINDWEGYFGHY